MIKELPSGGISGLEAPLGKTVGSPVLTPSSITIEPPRRLAIASHGARHFHSLDVPDPQGRARQLAKRRRGNSLSLCHGAMRPRPRSGPRNRPAGGGSSCPVGSGRHLHEKRRSFEGGAPCHRHAPASPRYLAQGTRTGGQLPLPVGRSGWLARCRGLHGGSSRRLHLPRSHSAKVTCSGRHAHRVESLCPQPRGPRRPGSIPGREPADHNPHRIPSPGGNDRRGGHRTPGTCRSTPPLRRSILTLAILPSCSPRIRSPCFPPSSIPGPRSISSPWQCALASRVRLISWPIAPGPGRAGNASASRSAGGASRPGFSTPVTG